MKIHAHFALDHDDGTLCWEIQSSNHRRRSRRAEKRREKVPCGNCGAPLHLYIMTMHEYKPSLVAARVEGENILKRRDVPFLCVVASLNPRGVCMDKAK